MGGNQDDVEESFSSIAEALGGGTSSPSTTTATISVSAVDLADEYEANEVAADRRYKDKVVRITGRVDDIGTDILDTPYLILETRQFWGVQCMFDQGGESRLASLQKGQNVSVVGRVDGKLMTVIVRGCEFR